MSSYLPNEADIRRWIKEAVTDYLDQAMTKQIQPVNNIEPLLTRRETASIFKISLVTLWKWTKKGLPFHRQGRPIYYLRSEVLEYMKHNTKKQRMNAQ